MKKALTFLGHFSPHSFTAAVLNEFEANLQNHFKIKHTIANDNWKISVDYYKQEILTADLLIFAFPIWWEMPPAAFVDFLQTIFTEKYCYETTEEGRKLLINKDVICLITQGQIEPYNTSNLEKAMKYCGLNPSFITYTNVGPRLTPEKAKEYLEYTAQTAINFE